MATAVPRPTTSLLLLLPGELRELIYGYYFDHDPTVPPPRLSRSPLALPLSCHQLYGETHSRAFLATTFRAHCWHLSELRARFAPLALSMRPNIKRLELLVPVSEFLNNPSSLAGLRFADAGLTSLEELYVLYSGKHEPYPGDALIYESYSGETFILENLEIVLWKTAVNQNPRLKKIRLVHRGAFRWVTIERLYGRMKSHLPLSWATTEDDWGMRKDLDNGRFYLTKGVSPEGVQRNVLILLGRTVREAEQYHAVRKELLEVSRFCTILATDALFQHRKRNLRLVQIGKDPRKRSSSPG